MVLRALVVASVWMVVVSHSTLARAEAAEVESLITKGNDLRREGKPGAALPYFQKAYELARTPRTTGQLGLAELAAGYPVEAADHLAAALETPSDPSIAKFRPMLADALTKAKSRIGELAIQGSPAGAEVVVDGRAVGTLPLSSPIKLAARTAEVAVRAPGYSERRESVRIAGGQRHELTVSLEKIAKPTSPAPSAIAATAPPPSPAPAAPAPMLTQDRPAAVVASDSKARTAAWLFGGGALVAGGTGLALNLAARSSLSDFSASCASTATGIVPIPGKPLDVSECRDRYDAWQSYRRWSVVGYISGAALAVTSTVLFFTSRPTSIARDASATLACGPSPGGMSCQGTF